MDLDEIVKLVEQANSESNEKLAYYYLAKHIRDYEEYGIETVNDIVDHIIDFAIRFKR